MENPQKPVFLIAEDEESNFTVLRMLLQKKFKAEILHARNGQEAVDIVAQRADINLVLMDIKMPVMDGYIATGIIKKSKSNLPVIAITAYGLSGDEHKALTAGCDDYIAKPIQTIWLYEKIAKLLQHDS